MVFGTNSCRLVFIYIPIWIDLKGLCRCSAESAVPIYIPIWIDLKVFSSRTRCYATLTHLHSNMDRFESVKSVERKRGQIRIYIPIWIDLKALNKRKKTLKNLYLHSNMDRFERMKASFHNHIGIFYLHSNMDRFESAVSSASRSYSSRFTFQYG